jgi:hypothetical protein
MAMAGTAGFLLASSIPTLDISGCGFVTLFVAVIDHLNPSFFELPSEE